MVGQALGRPMQTPPVAVSLAGERGRGFLDAHYLLDNRAQVTQKGVIMKRYSLLLGIMVAAVTCSALVAQEKTDLQPNATVLSILTGNASKAVELHLRSGEQMGGKVAGDTDNVVHLSPLTCAEFFHAFVDVEDISAVEVLFTGR